MDTVFDDGLCTLFRTLTRTPGVRIDIPVHATVEGLRAGRDEILEKALEMVRTGEYDPAAEK